MTEDQNINEENFQFKCPACKVGNIEMNKVYYDSPDGDKILIIKFECNRCNFHKNDVIPFTTHIEPGIMKLTITNEEDLKSKIYRSPIGELDCL
jgi:C4-type Zn-finger protein